MPLLKSLDARAQGWVRSRMLGEWLHQRREKKAEHGAARQRLYEEFQQRVGEKDADALEAARDYGDNDGSVASGGGFVR